VRRASVKPAGKARVNARAFSLAQTIPNASVRMASLPDASPHRGDQVLEFGRAGVGQCRPGGRVRAARGRHLAHPPSEQEGATAEIPILAVAGSGASRRGSPPPESRGPHSTLLGALANHPEDCHATAPGTPLPPPDTVAFSAV
jgi:hypothetical protein